MNVPGQRKHPSQVQVQPQQQPRGYNHNYPRGPTPPVNYNRQVGEQEGYENQSGRQLYRQQQQQQQQLPQQQFVPGYHQSGVPPHDMNKQPMSAQVPPPPGQTPPQVPGVQIMYSNVAQQVPRNAGYVQQRQNMGPRPPVAMMGPTNTVYSQQQMNAAVYLQQSLQPAQQFMTGQPQVLNYMAPGGQMQIQYPAQMQPYAIQRAAQPAQYNAATYYQQPPPANNTPAPTQVYYPTQQQQPTMVAAVQQQPQQVPQQVPQQQPQQQQQQPPPQQPQQQQPPQQQQRPMSTGGGAPYQKREKRGLAIVDPNTGRDITEDLRQDSSSKSITPPQSETSSERATPRPETPPPMSSVDIAAQFAAQVAATLGQPTQRQVQPQDVPAQATSATDGPATEPVASQETTTVESTEVPAAVVHEQKPVETPVADVSQSGAPEPAAPDQADSKLATQSTPETQESTPVVVAKKTPSPDRDEPTTKRVAEKKKVTKIAVASVTLAPVSVAKPDTAKDSAVDATDVVVHKNTEETSTTITHKPEPKTRTKSLENETKPVSSGQVETPVSVPSKAKTEVSRETKAPDVTAVEESRAKSATVTPVVVDEVDPKMKDVEGKEKDTRKKGRKKLRDLNEKGMKKEGGSDMDAFTEQKFMASPNILPPVESNNVTLEKQDEPTMKAKVVVVTPVIEPVHQQKPPVAPELKKQTLVPHVDKTPAPPADKPAEPQLDRTAAPPAEKTPEPLVEKAPSVEKIPAQTVEKATPQQTVEKATPPAAAHQTPAPTVDKTPATDKTPAPTVDKTPATDKTPAPTVDKTPAPTVDKTPAPSVNKTPAQTVDKTPAPIVDKTPAQTVDKTPAPTVDKTPAPTVDKTPVPTVDKTPAPTVDKTPVPTVDKTPAPTVDKTPAPTVDKTPAPTVDKTPAPTVDKTPAQTVDKTPAPTMDKTPAPAVDKTPAQTVDKTPAPAVDKVSPVQVQIIVEDVKVDEMNELNDEKKKEATMNAGSSNGKDEEKDDDQVPKKDDKVGLKYTYREDQWSPLNPEGKMQYDRSFLLQLQFVTESIVKPAGLPKLPDVILDAPHTGRSGDYRGGGGGGGGGGSSSLDFTPSFFRQPSRDKPLNKRSSQQKRGGGGGGGGMGGGPGGGMGNQPKVLQISIERDVQLHHTANAWKPPSHKTESGEETSIEELYRRVRAILNKLTPQKFKTLVKQCTSLEINTEERLKGSIDIIFEKALDEPSFSVAYASMCKCMLQLKVPVKDRPNDHVTFRALLLNRCQMEFERSKAADQRMEKFAKAIAEAKTPEEKKELELEKTVSYAKSKRRYLGNIRFIGELYKLKVLTEKIMHDCLMKLLRSNDEEDMECLCRLLTTIGKDIDHDKAKSEVDQYFQQIHNLIKAHCTSARVRFMLQDVVELRSNKWVPRRDDNAPKTIDQIHQEAQAQQVQQKLAMSQQKVIDLPKPTRGSGSRGGRGRPDQMGGGGNQNDDGWTAVGRMSRNIDPSRMKITKLQNVDDNIQLGPGGRTGFGGWGHGSSGGGKTSSQEGERSNTPSNRFSALSAGAGGSDGYDRPRSSLGGSRGMTPSREGKGHYGQMPPRGKSGSRSSRDQERESALAAARHLSSGYGSNRTTPVGSRNQSREPSRNRDSSRGRDAQADSSETDKRLAAGPVPTEHNTEYIDKKTKALVDEYLQIHDLKEAVQCIKDLESPKGLHRFVSTGLSHVLERSSKARKDTGTLLNHFVKQNLISTENYMKGLQEILEFAEDMQIDIPMIMQYLGELIGPMMHDDCLPLTSLRRVCEPLPTMAGILVAEILHDMARKLGHIKVGESWRSSRLQWSDFLKASDNEDEFVQKHKLEFTQSVKEPRSPDGKSLPIGKIWDELNRLIVKQNVANEEVIDWIEASVGESHVKEPAFIRALMTAICNSAITGEGTLCKVDIDKVKKRLVLLVKYLDHKETLELQALYALQALIHHLEHPPNVLRTFFDAYYDEDIISEDAFNQWEESADPAEQAGKGVAKTSVVQFFIWLREADEELPQEDS